MAGSLVNGSKMLGLRLAAVRFSTPVTSKPVGAVLPGLLLRDETAFSLSIKRYSLSGSPTMYCPRRPIAQFWPLVIRFFSCRLLFQMNFSLRALGEGGTSDQQEPLLLISSRFVPSLTALIFCYYLIRSNLSFAVTSISFCFSPSLMPYFCLTVSGLHS